MKKCYLIIILALLLGTTVSCSTDQPQIVATTLPVYEFTSVLCQDTDISVGCLVTESVSCLHDYTLQVSQMRMIGGAELVIQSGAGLEDFLNDALMPSQEVVNASTNIDRIICEHGHDGHDGHNHQADPHVWLSPKNAKIMVNNIYASLVAVYPDYRELFSRNLVTLQAELDALQSYALTSLRDLNCRELVTFHDGFSYFADAFDLSILRAVEEESGSEASAAELKELISLITAHSLPAIFTETNGSTSAADIIAAETGVAVFTLDMAMSGQSYFESMYHNIDTIREALG